VLTAFAQPPSHPLSLPKMSIVAVQIPLGIAPGGQFMAIGPGGVQMMVVNPGLPAGSIIHVRAPAPPPPVQAGAPQPPTMERQPTKAAEAVKEEDIPKDAKIEQAVVPDFQKTTLAEAPNQADLCPFMACCCVAYSLYPTFPDCLGFYQKGTCCGCIETEQLCCKVSKTDGVYCKLCNGELEVVKPVTCCKITETMCCFDARFAIPTDEETPCQMACLGFICVKSLKCHCAFYDSRAAAAASSPSKEVKA